jgi:hypothetical protein
MDPGTIAFLRGLRVATLAVAVGVTLGLSLPTLVGALGDYGLPGVQVGAYATLAALIVVDAVLTLRGRAWGRWRWPAVAVLLAAALGSRLLLPPGQPLPVGDWSYGEVSWIGLLVLVDLPLGVFVAFMVGYTLLSTATLQATTPIDPEILLAFALSTVAICTFQMAVAAAGVALRRVAASALVAAREAEQLHTAQLVARSLHEDRLRSYGELARTARPLLSGLADGSADPSDPAFRRRCAIESARMRRLFAESDDAADPLMHELRACIDAAERRGVVVALAARGSRPALPRDVRRALTDAPLAVLATATSAARVTVVGTPSGVAVSVTADVAATDVSIGEPDGDGAVTVRTIGDDNQLWVEARWAPGRVP